VIKRILMNRHAAIALNGFACALCLFSAWGGWPSPLSAVGAFAAGASFIATLNLIFKERELASYRAQLNAEYEKALRSFRDTTLAEVRRTVEKAAADNGMTLTEVEPPRPTRH
jgi:hypothetical protein